MEDAAQGACADLALRFFGLRLFPNFVLVILPQRDETGRPFGVGAFRVESEKAGEDLVLEFRGPVEPRLGCLSLVRILFDELGRGTIGEVVPAKGTQHGVIYFGVENAQRAMSDGFSPRAWKWL